jgi:hypothetical protein
MLWERLLLLLATTELMHSLKVLCWFVVQQEHNLLLSEAQALAWSPGPSAALALRSAQHASAQAVLPSFIVTDNKNHFVLQAQSTARRPVRRAS